ncbi:SDR family NAD(P)-dependent oxidoreductase [Chryseobacterium sp. D764]|jgi:NAD(P)-dependent dehydrogenase (short-subunit alcohol dehydrogenase family)|uniref:SDR family NAD(P)-dependent oxidoreductase n=1 Tax=unclassified Chryseobacterium TaxID=2593645 RepID=UPI0015C1D958|nr:MULTISPECIES: SDR family NAD(P)-dependent oxidoreductase [unclassified Chryseobacterium]QXU50462.1 SDR family NAD(P)-dependent oxidoreductase [Chryseobacterium sp. D764]CAD0218941.1 KR domain-containing protein [Chryseobacterium sp. JV274]
MNKQKVWFITGASRGMGLEAVKEVLHKGDKVIAISRNIQHVNNGDTENLLSLQVDITNDEDVKNAIKKGIQHFGGIDVVLNNAGYYLAGSVEEIKDEEFRKTMDVNLFGMVNVIRHTMPFLRKQRSGHIINISSNMGYVGYANTGSYNASKFAVIGLSEALAQEVKVFGVNVTVVAPGMFRTGFMSEATLTAAENRIEDYHLDKHIDMLQSFHGYQPGDPVKLAQILYNISTLSNPPLHLILGKDSYESILEHRKNETEELEQWKHLSFSTDFK